MLEDENYFFFFETNKFDKENYRSYYFINPVKIITLDNPDFMPDFFNELNELNKNYFMAGFFSYEMGYILEDAFKRRIQRSFPLAFFCAYENPSIFDHNQRKFISGNFQMPKKFEEYSISNLEFSITEEQYNNNIQTIRDYIRKGDIYQANYTIKYKFDFSGSPYSLYNDLKQKQYAAYNVFAKFDDTYILSLSPELFFRKKDDRVFVKPMKGTWHRGKNLFEDKSNIEIFANDEKNKSENIMIVDLLRNDLGKISKGGSVKAVKLYEIEKYNTLFQMTSTVESVLENNLSIFDLIKGIFPSGSITGAPKIRSMEIIRELEKEDRKLYTGSLGFFEPNGNSVFNVAIRTILLKGSKGEMGVGGGIVYDSTPEDEFRECKLKADFLVKKAISEFSIIETILYDRKYEHLDLHIKRMQESSEYFDYIFNKDILMQYLDALQNSMPYGTYKVRVLLDRFGNYSVTKTKFEDPVNQDTIERLKVTISERRTNSSDVFLFHKTTVRDVYEKELTSARERGFFDVIFMNENNEITECAITNIYVKIQGELVTPPLECGLLNGTMRQALLGNGRVTEKKLTLQDIEKAEAVYVSNAIIGLREAVLEK
jgi:para-aminobenzoate synthetase / 4-amino-4-deoxychorismate lyase